MSTTACSTYSLLPFLSATYHILPKRKSRKLHAVVTKVPINTFLSNGTYAIFASDTLIVRILAFQVLVLYSSTVCFVIGFPYFGR
jgi:hypothetical protein